MQPEVSQYFEGACWDIESEEACPDRRNPRLYSWARWFETSESRVLASKTMKATGLTTLAVRVFSLEAFEFEFDGCCLNC